MLPIQPPCNYISYHQPDRSPKAQNGEQKVRSQIRKREQASANKKKIFSTSNKNPTNKVKKIIKQTRTPYKKKKSFKKTKTRKTDFLKKAVHIIKKWLDFHSPS